MAKIVSTKLATYIQQCCMSQYRVKVTKADIVKIVLCRLNDNFKPMRQTRLYQEHGGDYCRILEVVETYFEPYDAALAHITPLPATIL